MQYHFLILFLATKFKGLIAFGGDFADRILRFYGFSVGMYVSNCSACIPENHNLYCLLDGGDGGRWLKDGDGS